MIIPHYDLYYGNHNKKNNPLNLVTFAVTDNDWYLILSKLCEFRFLLPKASVHLMRKVYDSIFT